MAAEQRTQPIIGKKLKALLSERGITATELGRMADVRTSFIYDVLSGKSKNPSIITLSKIANALAIPLSELSGNEKQGVQTGHSSKLSQHYISIPKLSINISGDSSANMDADECADIDHCMFRRHWVRDKLNTLPEHLRMLSVTGDSMEPTLGHGDIILVDTSKTGPTPPGIFVLYDGYGLVVKRVEMLPSSGGAPTLSIKSDNSQYSPYERSLSDTRILGRVVWFAREL